MPTTPYKLSGKQRQEARIALAKAADLLRMEGKLAKAEELFRRAARYAEAGAAAHLIRTADHCRQMLNERHNRTKKG